MLESLALGFGLRFADLHDREGLVRLDGCFVAFLAERDRELHARLMAARAAPAAVAGKAESALIIELAPVLEDFIAALFGVGAQLRALASRHAALAPLYRVKRLFVQRRAAQKHRPGAAAGFVGQALRRQRHPLVAGPLAQLRVGANQQPRVWRRA